MNFQTLYDIVSDNLKKESIILSNGYQVNYYNKVNIQISNENGNYYISNHSLTSDHFHFLLIKESAVELLGYYRNKKIEEFLK